MDARQRRSLEKLTRAILKLASDGPVDALSVSQVAELAGVHRSTFYEHASSPTDLLQTALRNELDALREEFLGGVTAADVATAVTGVTEAVLHHVDSHASIYQRALGAGSAAASLHSMLSAHFQESTRLLLRHGALTIPVRVAGLPDDGIREGVAHFVADGFVGLIEVWLQSPSPRETGPILALFAHLVPSWWPMGVAAKV